MSARRLRPLVLVAAFLLTECAYTTIESYQCPTGSTVTYANFGSNFMDQYCQRCHGSLSPDRQGAPGEFIFDTRAQVVQHRARIFVRSAAGNDSMPPGPNDPSMDERNRLAEWLACGAP